MCKVNTMSIDNCHFKVADIKRKYMQNIVDSAKKCDFIKKVVLFGSSIEERCTDASDIDLAIFGTYNRSKALTSKKYERFARQLFMFDNHTQNYDLLYFKNDTKDKSAILEEISKGEVVYECE